MIDRIPDKVRLEEDPCEFPTSMLLPDTLCALLLAKMNEVIEAVNAMEKSLQDDLR